MDGKILIIEDDMVFAEGLKIKFEGSTSEVIIKDFSSGLKEIDEIAPDVVVLDVFQGAPQYGDQAGLSISDHIWEKMFVPIIFASAGPIELNKILAKHPLICRVTKSPTAFDEIVANIGKLLPLGQGIREIRKVLCSEAEQTTQKALTETAPHTIKGEVEKPEECLSLLKSVARRRLSALMRQKSEQERQLLFAWEQYIYPPPELPHCLMGDILVSTLGDRTKPEAFRVVLTPSCDLANPKVNFVLVAKCVSMSVFLSKNGIPADRRDAEKKLLSTLTQPQSSGYAALPAYSDLIPSMAISLRDLELINIENGVRAKSANGEEFERLISVDSPFREQLAWAYLQIAGRPGVPDREMKGWIKEILNGRQ